MEGNTMAHNLKTSKDAQFAYEQFKNELTIILHTSKNVVDKQTYEVFEKAYALIGDAAFEMKQLIEAYEELAKTAVPTQG
jgi:hypothetical protein